MSTDLPYPTAHLAERMTKVETRQEHQDAAVAALLTTTAVHSEQMVTVKEDVVEVKQTLSNILRAIWALVLVLIPVAFGIIVLAIQGG
jgi:long-subunit acyl-CoA synthetase (AMP-forming)